MSTYLFTYGTLRPGGSLDDLTPGHHVGRGIIPGQLYRHQRAHFPVFRDVDTGPVVHGDVFEIPVDQSRSLDFVLDMETGAGYDLRIREVDADVAGRIRIVPCITFVWPDRFPVGPRIYCGDWLSSEARDVCSDIGNDDGFVSRH